MGVLEIHVHSAMQTLYGINEENRVVELLDVYCY